jgi:hypothetical protein
MYYASTWKGRGQDIDAALTDVFAQIRADKTMDSPEIMDVVTLPTIAGESEAEASARVERALEGCVGECAALAVDGGFVFAAFFNGDSRPDGE